MAKNKSLEKDNKKKVPFNILSKKGLMSLALAGVMMVSPFMLAGCSNGLDGKDGAPGAPGTICKSGTSCTEFADAKVGDYFIDTDDFILYQKSADSWLIVMENYGRPGNNGQDGTNGTDGVAPIITINDDGYWVINGEPTSVKAEGNNGATWLSGIEEPKDSLGKISDFYMDEFNHTVYEKKANGWVLITQIAEAEKTYFYYADLATAISVVNNADFNNETMMADKSVAKVGIYLENDMPHVVLFNDVSVNETILLSKSLVLNLNSKTISFTSCVGFEINTDNVIINAEIEGSKIVLTSTETSSTVLKVIRGKCSVLGGEIIANSDGLGNIETSNPCVFVDNLADLYMKDTKVVINDASNGTVNAILIKRGGEAYLSNVNAEAISPFGLDVSTLLNDGEATCVKSSFIGKSNYTANDQGTDYASHSKGVNNLGVLRLKDCFVEGNHSGMATKGIVYIDGGEFGGYGHGGIYFAGGQTTSYVKNATIKQIPMFEGFYDDGVAGCNQAGMYVGGANNIIIYMDNCVFTGAYYPFVMKKNCSGNKLYVSNSIATEGFTKYIRLDTTANTLYIGKGNNFDIITCYQEGAAFQTYEDYLIHYVIEEQESTV